MTDNIIIFEKFILTSHNQNTFDNIEPKNSSFDFSQYNDDETKKKVVMITKTNTVIT